MKTNINMPNIHREISFSQSFQFHNHFEKSNYQSPAIAIQQRIQSTSRYKNHNRYQSPLRNQIHKYMPINKNKAEFKSQAVIQTQFITIGQESSHKKQKSSQINKRIKKLLIDIQEQESRKSYFNQKVAGEISENKLTSPSDYGKIKNVKKILPQDYKNQPLMNNQGKYFKSPVSKRKQNQFCTPTKLNHIFHQTSFNQLKTFEIENLQRTPLTERKINTNKFLGKKYNQESQRLLKNSVYSNFSQKRNKNKQKNTMIIKRRNVQQQLQMIDSKIKELQNLKKQLQIQLPNKSSIRQNTIHKSQLIKNSSFTIIQANELIIDVQSQNFQDQDLVQVKKKYQEKEFNCQKIIAQSKISNKQSEVLLEDVQIPKILKNIKNKKKGLSKEISSVGDSNVLKQQTTYFQDYECHNDFDQRQKQVINEKNNLLNELKYQIKLDDEFRKAKKWLQKLKVNNKWDLLMNQLLKNLCYITEKQIKILFSLHQDQENPFYYPQEGDFTIDEFVKVYLAADRHWNYDIVHSYSQRSLLASNFNEQNIDINGKGHINIQDLTRYINAQLDTSYRNRDIYLIYHRFKTSEKLYYSKILNCLCNK